MVIEAQDISVRLHLFLLKRLNVCLFYFLTTKGGLGGILSRQGWRYTKKHRTSIDKQTESLSKLVFV